MNGEHMILIRAFFGFDVVSHDTRYSKDPKITNFGNNMLEVRFLTKYGAQLLCDDKGKMHSTIKLGMFNCLSQRTSNAIKC